MPRIVKGKRVGAPFPAQVKRLVDQPRPQVGFRRLGNQTGGRNKKSEQGSQNQAHGISIVRPAPPDAENPAPPSGSRIDGSSGAAAAPDVSAKSLRSGSLAPRGRRTPTDEPCPSQRVSWPRHYGAARPETRLSAARPCTPLQFAHG